VWDRVNCVEVGRREGKDSARGCFIDDHGIRK